MPAQEYELSLHLLIFHSERSVRGFIFSDKGGTLNNYPCEGSGSREMKQREEGGREGGLTRLSSRRWKKLFFFFFMVNFIDRLLIEQRMHNYFTDRVMSNANDRAAISNCSIMFLKRFYRLSKT